MKLILTFSFLIYSTVIFATSVQYRVNAKIRSGNQIRMITEYVNLELDKGPKKIKMKKLQGIELDLQATKVMRFKTDSDQQFPTGEIGLSGSVTDVNGPRVNTIDFPKDKSVIGRPSTLEMTNQSGNRVELKLTPVRYLN